MKPLKTKEADNFHQSFQTAQRNNVLFHKEMFEINFASLKQKIDFITQQKAKSTTQNSTIPIT